MPTSANEIALDVPPAPDRVPRAPEEEEEADEVLKLVSKDIWNLTLDTIRELRADVRKERERNDRLVEALARKNDVPLFMPAASTPEQIKTVLEKSVGWFDKKPVPDLEVKKPGGTKQ